MIEVVALVAGTVPLSAFHLRGAPDDAPLLLFLYILVLAAALANVSLPSVQWRPDAATLSGVEPMIAMSEAMLSGAGPDTAIYTGQTKKRPL